MDSVRAMCKAKDLALQDLQNRCRASEALCKVLDRQSNQFEAANIELKGKLEILESNNLELRGRLEALTLENKHLNQALMEASNEVDQVWQACACVRTCLNKSNVSLNAHVNTACTDRIASS
jgi:hypothetical protein